jgi:cholesterol transport system auxiliary component
MIVIRCDDRLRHRECERGRVAVGFPGASHVAMVVLGMLVFECLGGCGKTKPSRYYQLTIPAAGAPTMTAATVPATIIVGRPSTSDLYKDTRLVYSVGLEQMGTYDRERWVGSPPMMIQEVFLRELRASGHYEGVRYPESNVIGDFVLRGRLYDFKEVDSGGTPVARLTMDMELRNIKTGATVWTLYYTHDEPVTAKTVPDVVSALNSNVLRAAGEVTAGLEQYFSTHPVKQPEHAQR